MTMPLDFAGDPAPQQLTAPCRKYSGRSRPSTEQASYRDVFKHLRGSLANRAYEIVTSITILIWSASLFREPLRDVSGVEPE
jgi:hypothetical protein